MKRSVPAEPLPDIARRLSALGHPVRLQILADLAASDCCCCKDVVGRLDLAQSTVSQHLKVLVDAGFLKLTAQGQRSLYSIDRDALDALRTNFACLVDRCCAPSAQERHSGEHANHASQPVTPRR